MKSNAVIQVSHLTKTFKKRLDKPITLKERLISRKSKATITKTVLDDISFEINKGQTTGIIGVNGSGKSTILKMLSKIYYPTSGNVKTNGRLVSLIELGAGFHPDFTGRENIYFNASIFGLNKKQIDKRIDEIIEFSELGYEIDEPIRKYSSGMYMRLAFSIVTHINAEIVLVDEILSVGDYSFQKKSFKRIKELIKEGVTFVIVSHNLDTLTDICEKVIWLDNGHIKMYDSSKKVVTAYKKACE